MEVNFMNKIKSFLSLWWNCFKFSVIFSREISSRKDILRHKKGAPTVSAYFNQMWEMNMC